MRRNGNDAPTGRIEAVMFMLTGPVALAVAVIVVVAR